MSDSPLVQEFLRLRAIPGTCPESIALIDAAIEAQRQGEDRQPVSIPGFLAGFTNAVLNDVDEDDGEGCWNCGGKGYVVVCIDDMCRGGDECIHGDGEEPCPWCNSHQPTRESALGELGCLFPVGCLMPGEHYTSECHTIEHVGTPDEAKAFRKANRLLKRARRRARPATEGGR